jgi:hypothetical protein
VKERRKLSGDVSTYACSAETPLKPFLGVILDPSKVTGERLVQGPNFFLLESLSPQPRVDSFIIQGSNTFLDVLRDDHAKARSSALLLKPGVASTTSSHFHLLASEARHPPYLTACSSRQTLAWGHRASVSRSHSRHGTQLRSWDASLAARPYRRMDRLRSHRQESRWREGVFGLCTRQWDSEYQIEFLMTTD